MQPKHCLQTKAQQLSTKLVPTEQKFYSCTTDISRWCIHGAALLDIPVWMFLICWKRKPIPSLVGFFIPASTPVVLVLGALLIQILS